MMQSDTRIEKADFQSETKSDFIIPLKKPFRSQLFRSSNPIRASRRKRRSFFCLNPTESLTTPHNIRSHHTAAYNRSDAGLTATSAAAHSESAYAAHLFLRPPVARTIIQSQHRVLPMTFLPTQLRLCSRSYDSRRTPTPHSRQWIG